MTAREISPDQLAALPIRRYQGEACLVATAADLERAMADIRGERVIGFDTETRPSFRKGESHPPSLVQVATARAVYLFQLRSLDCAPALAELLAAPGIAKAGVALGHDLAELATLFPVSPAHVVDLGRIARQQGIRQTGLRNLAGLFLGFRLPKGARTSNWAAPRLSPAQVNYAAMDAWCSRELYICFHGLGFLAKESAGGCQGSRATSGQ